MAIKYLRTSNIKNKTVLLRVDVNVPIENGKVGDAFRIEQVIPTIKLLYQNRNKIIICGHLGRPKGQWDEKFSLEPVGKLLADLLGFKFVATNHKIPSYHLPHLIFYKGNIEEEKHQQQLKNIHPKDITLLENLRFYPGEDENDVKFAKTLASLADVYPRTRIGAGEAIPDKEKFIFGAGVYVNDAFGVDHRKTASVSAVTQFLPSYAGLLLEKEIKSLEAVLKHAKKPFVVMTGGIKLMEKVGALENLGKKADKILIGGGVASLMFKSKGYEVGLSRIEEGENRIAWQLERNFKDKIILPVDVVVANEKMERDSIRVVTPYEVGKKEIILDCGPKTILIFANELKVAKTIVWNGPLGLFEVRPFHTATMALARVVGGVSTRKAYGMVGGGETVDAIRQAHQFEHIDHVSTGGGAMLEFLAGKKLPGIEALK